MKATEPKVPAESKMVAGFVPRDVAEEFAAIAAANDRSLSAELRVVVRQHVEAHRAESNGRSERAA